CSLPRARSTSSSRSASSWSRGRRPVPSTSRSRWSRLPSFRSRAQRPTSRGVDCAARDVPDRGARCRPPLRRARRARTGRRGGRPRRGRRAGRPERRRQVDAARDPRPCAVAEQRAGRARRRRPRRVDAAAAGALRTAIGAAEPRALRRARGRERRGGAAPAARASRRRPPRGCALGRESPARRPRDRAARRPPGAAARRAHGRARPPPAAAAVGDGARRSRRRRRRRARHAERRGPRARRRPGRRPARRPDGLRRPSRRLPALRGRRRTGVKQPFLLLRKDLLVLRRSPLLLGVLVAYPLVIALLIGLTAAYANAKPRVALVDLDGIPPRVTVAGQSFDVDALIDQVAKNVELVRMDEGEAAQQLAAGRVAAAITVPEGFVADLKGLVASPHLTLATGTGGITPRVRQQMQALVYNLNLHLQKAFIQADIRYVDLLLHGGKGVVLGHSFSIIGLDGAARLLARVPPSPTRAQLEDFVHDARLALALTDNAIRATAAPIVLDEERGRGRTSALSAQVQSYGLAITICFLGLMLAAGSLAAER